ncbi:MAG: tail fiber domain-containing protein [Candidatus Omnitrophota bacterium]
MTFDTTNKRVGINKTPGYSLDINGDMNVGAGKIYFNNGGTTTYLYSPANGRYSFVSLGNELLTIDNNNSIYVGASNGFLIYPNGKIELEKSDYTTGFFQLKRQSDTETRLTLGSGNNFTIIGDGITSIGTSDFDGTPATAKLVVKGSTNDGSTNIFVGRDSDEANVFTVDTNGGFTANGNSTIGSGEAGVDYTLTFNGETNDGVITWQEDEDLFDMACGLRVASGTTDTSGRLSLPVTTDNAIAVDASGNLWIADDDGLYKSTDKGQTRTIKDTVASVTRGPMCVFVASNGYIYWSPWGYEKLRRSTDGGENWGDVGGFGGGIQSGIWGFSEDTVNGYLFAGVYTMAGNNYDEIWRSIDNGANWTKEFDGAGQHIHDVAVDPYTRYVYATSDPGATGDGWRILRSTDNGDNFSTIITDIDCLKIAFFSGIRLFGGDDTGQIYKTTDDVATSIVFDMNQGLTNFSTVKIGSTAYFGFTISTAAAGTYPIIAQTNDGTNFNIFWKGTNTAAWSGVNFMAATSTSPLYAAVGGAAVEMCYFYPNTTLKTQEIVSDGDLVLDPYGLGVEIDGGLTVGSMTRAGDNNLRVEGTITGIGHLTFEGITSTGATGTGKLVFDTSPTFTTQITSPALTGITGNITVGGAGGWAGSIISSRSGDRYFYVDGATSGEARLSTYGSILLATYDGAGYNVGLTVKGSGGTKTVQLNAYGAGAVTTDASGNIVVTSDERLKNIQGNFTRGLEDLKGISPILYKWNEKSGYETEHTYAGFSAQNVQKNIPEAVMANEDGYLGLQDRPIIATLINAINEQQKEIDDLKARLDKLERATGKGE